MSKESRRERAIQEAEQAQIAAEDDYCLGVMLDAHRAYIMDPMGDAAEVYALHAEMAQLAAPRDLCE